MLKRTLKMKVSIKPMSHFNTDLNNFASFLAQEVLDSIRLTGEGGFREAAFTQLIMEYLSDVNETGNTQVCTIVHRNKIGNRLRQINGYGLWDNYETLDIFISDYKGDGKPYTQEKSRIISCFNLASKYLSYLYNGNYGEKEESAEESEFQQNFNSFKDSILRVRIILLTDGIVRKGVKVENVQFGDVTVITEIWDLERIYQIWSSQRKREPIEIDIPSQFRQKIPFLSIEQSEEDYTSYLVIVPGQLLADLYDVYGSRLLEQNVRVYLQNLGKVNKEIRKTILETPGMFMAYNNGISATATKLTVAKDNQSGNRILKYIKDLQIVNGGQTTSSIFYARKKDRADLSQVYVQMKITLVHDDNKMETVVSRISKYANSQNKVSETDLTSNQAFHITLEELSRTTWASPVTGHQQTRWYYERVKGQYKEEINKAHTPSRKAAFKDRNPPHQVITKEEFAKFRNAWYQLPFSVARGSQKNYLQFIETEGKTTPTRYYFQNIVATAILFKAAEKLYGKKPLAMGDLRYLAVPYALSWLNYHTDERINLEAIWKLQIVPEELSNILKSVLLKVNQFLQEKKPGEYALVSEWAKRESCWLELKKNSPKDWNIEIKSIRKFFQKANDNSNKTDARESLLLSVSIEEWEKIEQSGIETGKLTPIQIGAIRNIINRLQKQKPLTEQLTEMGTDILAVYKGYRKS